MVMRFVISPQMAEQLQREAAAQKFYHVVCTKYGHYGHRLSRKTKKLVCNTKGCPCEDGQLEARERVP